ncbi:MAG: hypothetical protein WAU68_06745 [Vitreimonas sp.]
MTDIAAGVLAESGDLPQQRINWARWALVSSICGAAAAASAATLAAISPRVDAYVPHMYQLIFQGVAFAFAVLGPVFCSWQRAIADGQLPRSNGAEPKYEHVSGWSAILLGSVVMFIAGLVSWASHSNDANRKIHADFGAAVVLLVSLAFVLVAAAPSIARWYRNRQNPAQVDEDEEYTSDKRSFIDSVGGWLSALDGVLVFAVANAVGANRQNFYLRYAILLATISACAALGYYWDAPWSFIPIAWGFFIAFAVSRRWAWIEGDRELAMLNPNLSQRYIRVGFDQDLRDEALVVFLSMFLLVPLALRQAQLLADAYGVPMFALARGANVHDVGIWIAFYGTELAKALPFVDWAEVYHVEGDAPVAATSALALHAVFLVRVFIDLVFLAALLQAISSASRDAQQRELFYRKHAIFRLDPFTEPDAFRALVRKGSDGWEKNGSVFNRFPSYDKNRLIELSAHRDERIRRAAEFLLEDDAALTNDPHYRLSRKSADRDVTPEDIQALVNEIVQSGPRRNAYQLGVARVRLLQGHGMVPVRREILRLITQAQPADRERRDALIAAIFGERRELTYPSRSIALDALADDVGKDLTVRSAIQQVADHDAAKTLQNRAKQILAAHPETA